MVYVASGQWWSFSPTKLCVDACPDGFSLKNPKWYGGDDYSTGWDATTNTLYSAPPGTWYTFETQDVVNRCFPKDTSGSTIETALCTVPSCTNQTLNATLGGTLACVGVESQPDADNVWKICPTGTSSTLCAQQEAACELKITESRE